ncbi:MAG: peptidylprolyl isomerase [Planctomycetes bacterium]|nr:peptidylprolyl isomerase [Planctomycetota bacterium]
MAKHKAPTEVTLVGPEEKSALAEFVERHWPKAAVLAVLVTAVILFTSYRRQQAQQETDQSWSTLVEALSPSQLTGRLVGDPEELDKLAQQLQGTHAGPWALFLEAESLYEQERAEEAARVIERLVAAYPDHALVKQKFPFEGSVTDLSLPERLRKVYDAEITWRAAHPGLYVNPEPPAGAPRVRIRTDKGDVVVALYTDRAPKTSENFLKLAGEGYYDGTHVHRVAPNLLVEAGDPASREGDSETWGEVGADYTLEKEDTGLSNFAGYMGMVTLEGQEGPNGSLFYWTAGPLHMLNRQNVVFAKVLEGQDVVKAISEAATEPPIPVPLEPITILGTDVLPGA